MSTAPCSEVGLVLLPTHVQVGTARLADLHYGPLNVDALIRAAFTWDEPGAHFRQKYHREKKHPRKQDWCRECSWDGKRCLYQDGMLSQGFLSKLEALLQKHNVPYRIVDTRPPVPPKQHDWRLSAELRGEYQVEQVAAMVQQQRGVVAAATGAGKSIVAAAVVCELGLPAIVVVPTKLLLGQFIETFHKYTDIPVGRIGSGKYEAAPVQVAIAKSLVTDQPVHPDVLTKSVLIVDEMHLSASATWEQIVNNCPAYYRFGFSATPYRKTELEDNVLLGMCGEIISSISVSELQEMGFLAKTDIRVINLRCGYERMTYDEEEDEQGRVRGWRATNYAEQYRAAVVQNEYRNEQVAQLVNHHAAAGEKTLVIINYIEHAERLMALFDGEAIFLTGRDTAKQTEEKRLRFREQRGGICIGTSIVDIGFDVPAIDVLVLAGGGEFDGRTIQRLGRGLRPSPGKDVVVVYDIKDDDRPLFIHHGRSRIKAYESIGQAVSEYESVEKMLAAQRQLRLADKR